MSSDIHTYLLSRVRANVIEHGWNIEVDQCSLWANVVARYLSGLVTKESRIFAADEYVYYSTPDQLRSATFTPNPDREYIHRVFQLEAASTTSVDSLPSPSILYNTDTKTRTRPCMSCGSHSTFTMPIQRRSLDEPVSYYTQCLSCSAVRRTG